MGSRRHRGNPLIKQLARVTSHAGRRARDDTLGFLVSMGRTPPKQKTYQRAAEWWKEPEQPRRTDRR